MTARVAVVGEALVDLLPGEGDTMRVRPGGSPANVAVALARLGVAAHFLGRTSTDRWGQRLRAHLAGEGVVLDGSVGDEPTAVAVVDLDADGQARYRFLWEGTADRMLRPDQLAPALERPDAVHVGSVASVLEPAASAIAEVVTPIGQRQVVSFDPNVRPALVDDPEAARRRLLALADVAHVVRASDEDLAFLFPGHDTEQAAGELLGGAQTHLVVVTHGADDAELFTPRFQLPVPVTAPPAVVDTIGAGDTFMAGLVVGLAEHEALTVPALAALDAGTAREVGGLASAAAAAVVGRAGADPPRRSDL